MKKYRIIWTEPAATDLEALHHFIALDDPRAAQRVAAEIVQRTSQLDAMPLRGRPGRDPLTRELVLSGWPWIVVYEIVQDEVQILRVFHAAQDRMDEDAPS
ncbi:MAG: type II toxin-antitoxin system RelE/ParE family toxin [Alphaproteobacteria bacterium]|nr:type II toxin-antitoxin system RelE/ParE family toxin [Alphaproteobacteria bacterium]